MANDTATLTLDLEFEPAGVVPERPGDWDDWHEYERRWHTRALTVGSWAARAAPRIPVDPERLNHGLFWGKAGDIEAACSLQSLMGGENEKQSSKITKVCRHDNRLYTHAGGVTRGAPQDLGVLCYELVDASLYPGPTWAYLDYHGDGQTPRPLHEAQGKNPPPEHPFRWGNEGIRAPYKGRDVVLTRPVKFIPHPHPDDLPLQQFAARVSRWLIDDRHTWRLPWETPRTGPPDQLFLRNEPVRWCFWDVGGRLLVRLRTSLGAGPTFVVAPEEQAELTRQVALMEEWEEECRDDGGREG